MSSHDEILAGKHCLVLDDEFMIALDIQQILEAAGAADVVCAADTADAMKLMDGGRAFHLAVLDVKLSNSQTSLSVATRLAEQKTSFIFLTGMSPDDGHIRQFPDVPVVQKPYQVPLLLEGIRQALMGSRC